MIDWIRKIYLKNFADHHIHTPLPPEVIIFPCILPSALKFIRRYITLLLVAPLIFFIISFVSSGSFDFEIISRIFSEISSFIFSILNSSYITLSVGLPIDLNSFKKKYIIFTDKVIGKDNQGERFGDDSPWAERLMREYNSTISGLERNINKAFDSFKNRISVGCSEFLRELDISPINSLIFKTYREEWRYRHNPTFMLKATIFMKLRGIKFQHGLIEYLKKNLKEAENLGCVVYPKGTIKLPARRSFNYFINERLTKEISGLIDFIVEYSKKIASKRGILLNFAIIDKPKKRMSDRTLFRKKKSKTKELCKLMRENIYQRIVMDLAHNTIFKKNNFLDMLTHTAMMHDFTENGSCTYAYQRKGRTPSADTLLYHLKKYKHRKVIENMYDDVFETTIEMARRSGFLKRPLDLAVDVTEILYYGDEDDYMVVGTKPKRGSTYAHKFATVNAVVNGERFMLYAIPVGLGITSGIIVQRLMKFVKNKVKIRRVLLDRGFYSSDVIDYFNKEKIKFIMPAKRTWRIKYLMKKHEAPYVMDYKMNRMWTRSTTWHRLVFIKGTKGKGDPKETYVFATNIDISANTSFFITMYYDRRWGIETSYRVKEAFRARTTSKNYIIRLFYFMFSVTLYNLWILVNTLLSLFLFGKLPDKPLITAKLFGIMIYTIEIT